MLGQEVAHSLLWFCRAAPCAAMTVSYSSATASLEVGLKADPALLVLTHRRVCCKNAD